MFNIGDKVSEKGRRRSFEIINKLEGDVLVLKELDTDELNIITFTESQVEEYVEVVKTNKIHRKTTGSVIEYEIDGNELKFNVTGHPMVVSVAAKILLNETKLYDYKYERVSPFKLTRSYSKDRKQHEYLLEFIAIRTYEKIEQVILKTDKGLRLEGEYKIFIPDFLEICVERDLLRRNGIGYELVKNIKDVMDHCEYLASKPSVSQLKKEGYTIPDKWNLYN